MPEISHALKSIHRPRQQQIIKNPFAANVQSGLTNEKKYLSCVYFYDERGSRLFEQICDLPEYYLTRAEAQILRDHAGELALKAAANRVIVELGSGSSIKTQYILEAFQKKYRDVTYMPIDVSESMLEESANRLRRLYPSLNIKSIPGLYQNGLKEAGKIHSGKLILWLGSSIGNFTKEAAIDFVRGIRNTMRPDDLLLIGIDLMKDEQTLTAAYDDAKGVTSRFNLNILTRINREFGANFNLNHFSHQARLNRQKGCMEIFIRSERDQQVNIPALDLRINFKENERIHTEDSHKYTQDEIETLAARSGLIMDKQWRDHGGKFSLNLFRRKS